MVQEIHLFDKCVDGKGDCILTKYEICKKIANHYLYRINILQAIYHVLPRKVDDNKFIGSFYYNRILSLKNGNMCLPSNIEKFKQSNDTEKICFLNNQLKGINIDNDSCKYQLYKNSYDEEDLEKLRSNSEYAKKHKEIQGQLENEYIKSITILYGIILRLKTDKIINNSELYKIGELTKKTIDNMYYNAQFNYITGLLNYIKYNTPSIQKTKNQQPPKEPYIKKIRNSNIAKSNIAKTNMIHAPQNQQLMQKRANE